MTVTAYEPIPALPVMKGVKALLAPVLPTEIGHLPVDGGGAPVGLPVFVIDAATPTWRGPAWGDVQGEADWAFVGRVIAERTDQATLWADRVLNRVLARVPQGEWVNPIVVPGQWVTWRAASLAAGYDAAPSADGIVALVVRFTVRTQRAG